MGFRVALLCVAVSMVSAVPVARAVEEGKYSRKGFHAGASVVVGIPTFEDDLRQEVAPISLPVASGLSLRPSAGFDLRGGYRLNPRVAAEMGFEWVAPYRVEVDGRKTASLSNWMFYVDAKVFILTERIQPFLLLGMGAYHMSFIVPTPLGKRDATAFAPRFGGGLEYYFTRHVALTSEVNFVIGTADINDRNRIGINLGLFYRF